MEHRMNEALMTRTKRWKLTLHNCLAWLYYVSAQVCDEAVHAEEGLFMADSVVIPFRRSRETSAHSVALKLLFAFIFFREEKMSVEMDLSYPRGVTVMRLKRRVNRAVCVYVNCSVM